MSQYLKPTPIGSMLLAIYKHDFMENNKEPYYFQLESFPFRDEKIEYIKMIDKMVELKLITTETKTLEFKGPATCVKLTQKGKIHASELTKILDNIPELP